MKIDQEHLSKLKSLMDSVKRAKAGKPLTKEQEQLWNQLCADKSQTAIHTLSAWATAAGMESRTLERKLAKSGYITKPDEKISFKMVLGALISDKSEAEIRLKEAQAADQERKNKIADGEMIPLTDNLEWQQKVLLPIRQRLLSLAPTQGPLCNPSDPQHAETQLWIWVNETLPILREEIGKVGK